MPTDMHRNVKAPGLSRLCIAAAGLIALVDPGCSSSGGGTTTGAGGHPSAGASGEPDADGVDGQTAGTCSNVTACGGSVVGTWTVASSCLTVSGSLDTGSIGLGCASSPVTGSLHVSGTFTANANGSYADNTTTTGAEQIALDASCLHVSGTTVTCDRLSGANGPLAAIGYASASCAPAPSGGCICSATVHQSGGVGVVSLANASTSGYYTASGDTLEIDTATQYSICASSGRLTLTPATTHPLVSGTIVLQSAGTGGGTGGAVAGHGGGAPGGGKGTDGVGGTGGVIGAGGATGGSTASGGQGGKAGSSGAAGAAGGPCDIYQSANTPCVGAYSTVRALYGAYAGPLYQVKNSSGATKDILVLAPGGFADSSAQDGFCTGACTISVLYDQSPQHNDLPVSPPVFWLKSGGTASDAKAVKISVGGHAVYGLKFAGGKGNSYRNLKAKGTATGDQPETIYEVVDSKTYNNQCCNDFGNASTDGNPDGAATMEAIYWGNDTLFGSGGGNGPWILADLEAGTFGGTQADNSNNTPIVTPAFATLTLKGFSGNRFALKGGDAQAVGLVTKFDGARPSGYSPMKKQGSIVLGTGGDGSFYSTGIFFEGAITSGCADGNTVDDAIQANVVAAGYGK